MLDHRIGVTELLERRLFITRMELPDGAAGHNLNGTSAMARRVGPAPLPKR